MKQFAFDLELGSVGSYGSRWLHQMHCNNPWLTLILRRVDKLNICPVQPNKNFCLKLWVWNCWVTTIVIFSIAARTFPSCDGWSTFNDWIKNGRWQESVISLTPISFHLRSLPSWNANQFLTLRWLDFILLQPLLSLVQTQALLFCSLKFYPENYWIWCLDKMCDRPKTLRNRPFQRNVTKILFAEHLGLETMKIQNQLHLAILTNIPCPSLQ